MKLCLSFTLGLDRGDFGDLSAKKQRKDFPSSNVNTNFKMDMFNVVIGIIWQTSLVAAPIFLVIHEYALMAAVMTVIFVTTLILKFTWWDNLEKIAGRQYREKI